MNNITLNDLTELRDEIHEVLEPLASMLNESNGLAPTVSSEAAKVIRDTLVRGIEVERQIIKLQARIDEMKDITAEDMLGELDRVEDDWKAKQF